MERRAPEARSGSPEQRRYGPARAAKAKRQRRMPATAQPTQQAQGLRSRPSMPLGRRTQGLACCRRQSARGAARDVVATNPVGSVLVAAAAGGFATPTPTTAAQRAANDTTAAIATIRTL